MTTIWIIILLYVTKIEYNNSDNLFDLLTMWIDFAII